MPELTLRTTPDSRSRPLVSVVIVNYNSGLYLAACVRSVASSTHSREELIIVDNASEDDSVTRVEALHPEAEIVQSTDSASLSPWKIG